MAGSQRRLTPPGRHWPGPMPAYPAAMAITLTSLGGARTVTGSRHLIDTGRARILIDCGLHQERDLQERNWEAFPLPPSTIDAVVLTHGHLDHCGLLPRLVAQGFAGRIICTPATADIAHIVMADSARLQVEDVETKRKRHQREQRESPRPLVPLYNEDDVAATLRLVSTVAEGVRARLAEGLHVTFHDAGHVLGSSMVLVEAEDAAGGAVKTLFSGDIGRRDRPIVPDPHDPPACDVAVIESTYGDRLHPPGEDVERVLGDLLAEGLAAGGPVLIPCFAVERAQDLLWHLNRLRRSGRLPAVPVFLDSPMAVKLLEVYRRHREAWDDQMKSATDAGEHPLSFDTLRLCEGREASKRINDLHQPFVVIAGAGMCNGGRIKHHLLRHLPRREAMVLFIGYQASGTLGRLILDGARQVRLFGGPTEVRARVAQVHGFSGHADRDELTGWLARMPRKPKRVLVVHGGENVTRTFAAHLSGALGVPAYAPGYQEPIDLLAAP